MTDTALKPRLSRAHVLDLLARMIRVREFEGKCAELYSQEKIRGFLHLYDGEEAVAAGVIPVLEDRDRVVATYREHGHALVRGVPMGAVMAEMFGKSNGCSRGRGGSMHLFDASRNFHGGNAIVGGGLPMAAGLALADHMRGQDAVTACFFGEGAVAEGEFHESLNLAGLWGLPVLFVCENNRYAMGTALDLSESETDIHRKAESYRIKSEAVDGMDVVAVEAAARRAIAQIRETGRPYFLECRTYRFRAHSMFDAQLYRDKAEVEAWKAKDPITRFQGWAEENGLVHPEDVDNIRAAALAEIDAAVAFAEAGEWEPVEELTRFVYAPERPAPPQPRPAEPTAKMVQTSYREAVKTAIREALSKDERAFLMGEDVGRYGGCYAVSKGLLAEFGPDRIRDTPLSESGFTGAGIGAAMAGMRPIVEVMTVNFSLLALDQILNTAATIRHMSGNQFGCPVVIRMATGAGRQVAAQHSHSLEGWYAHIPGIRVLAPATLEDARGMLWTALQEPDPVLIFENVMLYNRAGEIAADAGPVDIDRAAVRRAGRDLSLVTYGGSLFKTLDAADALAKEGIEAEVIDLRTLRPAGRRDDHGLAGQDAAGGDRRRGLEERVARRRDRDADRRAAVLRPGRAARRGCAAPRSRSPTRATWRRPPFPRRTRSSPPPRRCSGAAELPWPSSSCRPSAPTWTRGPWSNGSRRPAKRSGEATSSRSSRPRRAPSRSRSSRTACWTTIWSSRASRSRSGRRWRRSASRAKRRPPRASRSPGRGRNRQSRARRPPPKRLRPLRRRARPLPPPRPAPTLRRPRASSPPAGASNFPRCPAAGPAARSSWPTWKPPPRPRPRRRSRRPVGPKAAQAFNLDQMRQAIAAAMSRSKREIPHYYLSNTVDVGAATAWVAQANAGLPPERRFLAGALFVKAVALAARAFPEFNGAFQDGAFRPSAAIHVGVAVSIRGGGLDRPGDPRRGGPAAGRADGADARSDRARARRAASAARRSPTRPSPSRASASGAWRRSMA